MVLELVASKRWNGIGNFLRLIVPEESDKAWYQDQIVQPLARYMSRFDIILNSKDKHIPLIQVDYPDIGVPLNSGNEQ